MKNVFLFAVGLAALRLIYSAVGVVGLSPDEAQYWHWLARPEWSYVTKPPLITWLMAMSTSVFGDTYLGVRFFAAVGHGAASILAFLIAEKVHSRGAGWWAFWGFQVTPLLAIGGVLMVTDVPVLVCWLGALYVLLTLDIEKYTAPKKGREMWLKWGLVGILVGFGGLAKYTAVFFYPLLGFYLLWQQPRFLLQPQVYVAGGISLLMQAPVLWWNYTHDWAGIKHVIGQAGGEVTLHDAWQSMGDFLAGQAGVLGVVSFLGMLAFYINPRGCSDKQKVLWAFAAPLFAFFVWQALDGKVQANWPILATSVSLIAVCTCLGVHKKAVVRWVFGAGLILNAALSFFLHDTFMLRAIGIDFPMKVDPSKDLRGWDDLAAQVADVVAAIDVSERPYVLTTRYRVMAEMAFELQRRNQDKQDKMGQGDIDVIYVNGGHRLSQYDLWPWPELEGRTAVVVRGSAGLPLVVKERFLDCEQPQNINILEKNILVRQGVVTVCREYVGVEKIMPRTH